MAINLTQQPTSPGMTNSDYLFSVTSSQVTQPQFQFVADLTLSGSSTVLQRIKQQPNPSLYGVFNLGQIVASYLESDNSWKAAPFITSTNVGKRFSVKFGEEYGTSISSSVAIYNGISAVTGSPALTGSSYYYVVDGLVNPYDAVNFNFDSGSYFTASAVSTTTTFSKQHALTNAPLIQSIQDGEYATISLINGNFTNSTSSAQDIFAVRVRSYNSSDVLLDDVDLSNLISNGGGPRANGTQVWSNVAAIQTSGSQLITIGVGPQNLADAGDPLGSTWAYYIVNAVGQQSAGVVNYSGSYAELRYEKQGPQCGYDGVRFAWKNEFGVWDYYTFTLQTDKAFNIERQEYEQEFVNYSTTTPTVSYDRERRGASQFYNALTQTQIANSNWLTQDEADWLKELFFSANVFQQIGSDFFPIVISSANLVEKTNPRTQGTFQYIIEFKPANQLRPRI
jgi:hypothetical protein